MHAQCVQSIKCFRPASNIIMKSSRRYWFYTEKDLQISLSILIEQITLKVLADLVSCFQANARDKEAV